MKLFKYEGYEVKVSPEALLLKPFRKIWTRDKDKNKETATNELSFLYFFCDPRSDYQYITDDEDRMEAVKQGIGFDKKWKPDPILNDAVSLYRSFDSSSAILLRAAREGVEKVQKMLREMDLTETDNKGKPVYSVKDYMAVLKMVPEVAAMIQEAEVKLNQEEELGEARGSIEKGMFEDGLDDVAGWVTNQTK